LIVIFPKITYDTTLYQAKRLFSYYFLQTQRKCR